MLIAVAAGQTATRETSARETSAEWMAAGETAVGETAAGESAAEMTTTTKPTGQPEPVSATEEMWTATAVRQGRGRCPEEDPWRRHSPAVGGRKQGADAPPVDPGRSPTQRQRHAAASG